VTAIRGRKNSRQGWQSWSDPPEKRIPFMWTGEPIMVDAIRNDQSLGEALVERAHRASARRLSFDIAGGLLAFGIIAAWQPESWGIPASAAVCIAMYGVWGATDRLLSSPDFKHTAFTASLLIMRTIAIAGGVAASLIFLFGTLGVAMGVWTH
jgi:hypothetical protein